MNGLRILRAISRQILNAFFQGREGVNGAFGSKWYRAIVTYMGRYKLGISGANSMTESICLLMIDVSIYSRDVK